MFDRFSQRARRLMSLSRQAAQGLGHDWIGSEHILLGLLDETDGIGARALLELGMSPDALRARAKAAAPPPSNAQYVKAQFPFTKGAKAALEGALAATQELGTSHISSGHVLLGLLRDRTRTAGRVLAASGVTSENALPIVTRLIREDRDLDDAACEPQPTQRFGTSAQLAIGAGFKEAQARGDVQLESEHVLLGLLESDGLAARILGEHGVTADAVRARIKELRAS